MTATDINGAVVGTAPALPPTPLNNKPAAVSSSTNLSITNSKSGTVVQDSAPITIPKDVKWSKPETAVTAKPAAQFKSNGEKVLMTFVQDGDTASGKRADGSPLNCRIETIDAPETAKPKLGKPGQAYGEESRQSLEKLIQNKEVNVRVVRSADSYGRSICQIEVEGKNVGVEMARMGAAWAYQQFGRDIDPRVTSAVSEAKKAGLGLWAGEQPENPRNFRRRTE